MKNHPTGPSRCRALRPLAAGVLVLLGSAAAAHADEIKIGGINYPHVHIVGMRDGKLYFESAAGERSASLAEVQSIKIDKWPELAQADDALNNKDYAGAAGTLRNLLDRVDVDYLKELVAAKLVFALDRSGDFLSAARQYANLLTIDNGPLAQAVIPQGMPKDAATRAKDAAALTVDLKNTTDPFAHQYLDKVVKQLSGAAGAGGPAEVPGVVPTPGGLGGLVGGSAEANRDVVAEMLKSGQFAEAVKTIDAQLPHSEELSKLLFQRGEAMSHLDKQEMEAVLSYMRVVILFPRSSYAVRSLIGAGRELKKVGRTEEATKLLNEAKGRSQGDAALQKEIDQILGAAH